MEVAQTNVQLYNQLRDGGVPLDDLLVVHRAYELLTTLYSGYFQADGKPFVAHGVGVASILAHLGQPAEMLAVGLLHNVYGNADFGDGRGPGPLPARRQVVSEAMGEQIERLVARFRETRVQWRPLKESLQMLPRLDETDRRLVLIDLADYLEKYIDLGVLYYGQDGHRVGAFERIERNMVEVASAFGEPRLTEMLSSSIAAAAAARSEMPVELRPSDDRPVAALVVPRSCRRRVVVRLRVAIRRLRDRVRLRTRLRRLLTRASA